MAALLGPRDEHLRLLREHSSVDIKVTREAVLLRGATAEVRAMGELLNDLLTVVRRGETLTSEEVKTALRLWQREESHALIAALTDVILVSERGKQIKARTPGQRAYVQAIESHDLTFAVGPAGTGKTYLAMAMAIRALKNKEVSRIILVRPAVEAGEKLGFLPGDLRAKVDPYLRPLYDALFDMVDIEKAQRYLERGVIEVAPLAYMRGRTLNDSFIILDEAQNTTPEQMKMFLTRMGFGSKVVVTGDLTQTDLPSDRYTGLHSALDILRDTKGIAFIVLSNEDVVRHELVQRIVQAYEQYETRQR
ncbi:MAG TPA: PhoH family protein [Armatimonadetes bacterium]|nr:PhoH family protein [Armatimonadota bacterium]